VHRYEGTCEACGVTALSWVAGMEVQDGGETMTVRGTCECGNPIMVAWDGTEPGARRPVAGSRKSHSHLRAGRLASARCSRTTVAS